MAGKLGVDWVTLGMWERGKRQPLKRALAKIEGLLGDVGVEEIADSAVKEKIG